MYCHLSNGKFDTYLRLLIHEYVMLAGKLLRKYTQMYESKIHLQIITTIPCISISKEVNYM